MSYADAASKGPKQSPEEARAPPVPGLVHHDDSTTSSLVDVDSPHISSVKSDFEDQAVKTKTQAERLGREADSKAHEASQKIKAEASSAKDKAVKEGKKAKAELEKDARTLQENSDNPVFIANYLVWGIGGLAIGYGAYQKHAEGKLDWGLAGTVAGAVGVFAVGDYFASKWLIENKYPTK